VSARHTTTSGFHTVGANSVRHLRDGREAFPAMLDAIERARQEIVLEMYWIGADVVGARFRDRLAMRARDGVAVFVIYDGIGSLGLFRSFWKPLTRAGGHVIENGPVAPWRRSFRVTRLPFRDHRKILVVDGEVGFCGGLNLARPWLPREEGGANWRDDVIEVHGPASRELRALACESWHRLGQDGPRAEPEQRTELAPRVRVLANRISARPNRLIRRSYLLAIRRARSSVDIASPYFLPGPLFLNALRGARKRGVRVRVLVPGKSDVRLVSLAMLGVVDKLVREDIEVYAYRRSILHAKTAILDGRFVVIGSHNLDAFSWRFDLEANVVVDDEAFGAEVGASFEEDLAHASRLDLDAIGARPGPTRVLAWMAARFRAFL
jgi:cardiolipin synthase